MSTPILTQSVHSSNGKTPKKLTPQTIAAISERSGIEPDYVALWSSQLETGETNDDGPRLIQIWLNIISQERGDK